MTTPQNHVASQWRKELVHPYQQLMRKYKNWVKVVKSNDSGLYKFNVGKKFTAEVDTPRGTDYQVNLAGGTSVDCVIRQVVCLGANYEFDSSRISYDDRQGLTEELMGAVEREIDNQILAAAVAATPTDLTSVLASGAPFTANTLDMKALAMISNSLIASDVPGEEVFYGAIRAGAKFDWVTDPQVIANPSWSNDAASKSDIPLTQNFKASVFNNLPVPTAGKTSNYFWQKNAIGLVWNKMPQVMIDRDWRKGRNIVSLYAYFGVVAILPTGIRRVDIND